MVIRKISLTIVEVVKLLWRRIFWIAGYAVALAAIYLVFNYGYVTIDKEVVSAAPTANYVKYTSFTVNNFREGEDLTYTVCRDFKGNYHTDGQRTVYIVPPGKTTKDRLFADTSPFSGTIEGDACRSYIIKDSTYHLKPGKYQLAISGDVIVPYDVKKHYSVDSQVFTVYAQPTGASDLQAQINNLADEVNTLKAQLGISATDTSSSDSTDQPDSTTPTSTAQSSASPAPTPTRTSPAASTSLAPAPRPGLLDSVLSLLKGLL